MINYMTPGTFEIVKAGELRDSADHLFNIARNTGSFHRFISILTGRPCLLLDLSKYAIQKRQDHYAGQREVPLDQIRGTEGRLNAFDDHFHPLTEQSRRRWVSIVRARKQGFDLPPVNLIQVGNIYFVRDGHHRISVARALGQTTITAQVTAW
jgi:hypothetical protein